MENNVNTPKMSLVQRIISFFIKPNRLFESYKENPSWGLKLLIISCIGALGTYFKIYLARYEYMQIVAEKSPSITPEYLNKLAEMLIQPKVIIISLLSLFVYYVIAGMIVALVYYGVIRLFGGNGSYKQAVAVYTLSCMAISIGMVIQTAYMYFTNSLVFITLQKTMTSILFEKIDFFILWQCILLVFGISKVFDLPEGKSTLIIALIWLLGLGLSLGSFLISA